MNRYLLLGLNHTTAPLEVREKLAFSPAQQQDALARFRQRFPDSEAVLISTCNRVELYAARPHHGHPRTEEMIQFLAEFHDAPGAVFSSHLYHKSDNAVIEHLFSVASSLDSMVLGETQILGQVRSAYETAQSLHTTGPLLNPLFQRAIAVGKEVLSTTTLAEGRVSVASVAVECAGKIFESLADKTVLTIGAGKMTSLVLGAFMRGSYTPSKPGKLLVCNRDPAKAALLAARYQGQATPYERLTESLAQADIVITSTGSPRPIIDKPMLRRALQLRRFSPMFLIDIALPRDISVEAATLEQAYVYNLDDLQRVVAATQTSRQGAAHHASQIVATHVTDFLEHHRARDVGPVIDDLYKKYRLLADEELQRTLDRLPNITQEQQALLRRLLHRIVNKILHEPVKQLRKGEATQTTLKEPQAQIQRHLQEALSDLTPPSRQD